MEQEQNKTMIESKNEIELIYVVAISKYLDNFRGYIFT